MNNTCPSCGSVYGVAPQHVGRQFNCRKCNAILVVAEDGLQLAGASTQRVDASELPAEEENQSDTARVAPRTRRSAAAKGGVSEYLTFRKMIVPVIIQLIFWLQSGFLVVLGFIGLINGFRLGMSLGFVFILQGLAFLILGPLFVRIECEVLIVVFRIYDTLTDIKNTLQKK